MIQKCVFGRFGLNLSVFEKLLISYSCISFMKYYALRCSYIKVWFGFRVCGVSRFTFCIFFSFFLFFDARISETKSTVHALFTGPTTTLFRKKNLKMGPTTLFTHLKIILLQCFQFSFFNKISCIQMDPKLLSFSQNLSFPDFRLIEAVAQPIENAINV